MPAAHGREPASTRPDRRRRAERRTHVLYTDWRWAWRGHRSAARRTSELAEAGVDLYEPGLFALAIGLLLLSAADALFTLQLLSTGAAREVNPLMRSLIRYDVQLFVNLKLALTAGGIVFMVPCADLRVLRIVRVRQILQCLFAIYLALVTYEILSLLALVA